MRKRLPAIDTIVLRAWHRWLTYLSTGFLVATGLAWLALRYLPRGPANGIGPHPLAHPLLAAHGAIAMFALAAYGGVLASHVPRAWAARRNRWTGCVVAAVLAVSTASAWFLYYASSEAIHDVASACHWIVGLAVAVVLPLHIVMGRRARRSAAAAWKSFPAD